MAEQGGTAAGSKGGMGWNGGRTGRKRGGEQGWNRVDLWQNLGRMRRNGAKADFILARNGSFERNMAANGGGDGDARALAALLAALGLADDALDEPQQQYLEG